MKLYVAFAMLVLGPGISAVAEGHARTTAVAHMRPQLFHDRTPHIRQHTVQPHHGS